MNRKVISTAMLCLTVLTGILIPSCAGRGGEVAPSVEPTLEQNPASPAADALPLPTQTSTFVNPIELCKLKPVSFTNVGLGLPSMSHKLPALGTVRTIILFADFNDVPASQTPEEIFAMISPSAEKLFADLSYGRMDWKLEPHLNWLRLSQPSAHYGEGIRSYEGHFEFIQETVTLTDADVDFSNADSVVVMVPVETTAISFGPAFGANPNEGYSADGKTFANGVTSASDLPNWGFLWLNHESGHTMGLPDLYAYNYDTSNYDDIHRFVGGFGLMGFIGGKAPEFFAFERWQLGWLDDNQILCHPSGEMTATILPVEADGGVKAVMIPVSQTKAVVVESRRPLGYDANLPKSGALVYVVDTSIYSGEGTLVIYPILENDPYREQSPLGVGESVTVDGVTITVVESTSETDTVQVTIAE